MNFALKYFTTAVLLAGATLSISLRAQQPDVTKPAITAAPAPNAPATPPAVVPPQTVANPGQIAATYVIGPDDALSVVVWKEPSFSGNLAVRPDGMVSMPLLGDLQAAGMTPMALGEDIANRLKKYVHDPLVTVNVVTINSKRLYMLGQVAHVGPMPFTPDLTPLQAISAAGGLTPYANSKKIYVLRKLNGKEVKIPFNYKTALKTGNMQGVILMNGDTIVVP